MSLKDLSIPTKFAKCKVSVILQGLSAEDAEILTDAVMNPEWPLTVLSRELMKRDILVSDNTLRRHRLKGCPCWKV